jgi:replication factor A1
MDVDRHAEELASALGVDKEEVKADLENLLEYSVPIDEAKQNVRRTYGGGSGGRDATPESLDVAELTPEHGNVTVTVRVLTVGTRSIRYQGEDQVIREGELADETGIVSYTAWQDFGFEPGDTVTVGNASVREWEGEPELNLGSNTTVALESEALEVPYRVGGDRDLADLVPGDRGRNVEVRVLEVEERTIDGRDGETEILSGVLADASARLPFTDWQPRAAVHEGAALRLSDVYVREFRGVPSVNLTEFTEATELDEPIQVREDAPRLPIGEAVAEGGLFDVELVGSVLAVRDGSGLIERCPECGRVVQNGQCRVHGDVDGEDDMRVKAILDDGTGTATAVLDRELTEAVYGANMDAAREAAREAMDREVVADEIRDRIVGREARVRGNLSVDEYGANLDAETFDLTGDDPAERARALLEAASGAATDGGGTEPGTADPGGDAR